jgi:DNA-binding response OmpR family regulator
LTEFLVEVGFHVETFYDLETMIQEVSERQSIGGKLYDAYIVDWLVGRVTSEKLIQLVRSNEIKQTPIFLLTGELMTGRALESDVVKAIIKYGVSLHEKPSRLPVIAAELKKILSD